MSAQFLVFLRKIKTGSTLWFWLIASFCLALPDALLAIPGVGSTNCARINDFQDFGCIRSAGGAGSPPTGEANAGGNNATCSICTNSSGMPRWSVDEPYINLHIIDEPLSYKTSSGQDMAFTFYYKQNFSLPALDQIPDLETYGYGNRASEDPYVTQMRSYGSYAGSSYEMTGASWSHSWMANILFLGSRIRAVLLVSSALPLSNKSLRM